MRTKNFFITVAIVLVSSLVYSAPTPPCPTCKGEITPPQGLPINGHAYLLLGFAVLLAGHQLIIQRKNKKTQSKI